MKNTEELNRPAVQVRIPLVNLRLQDLAFLRSLNQPSAIRCRSGSNTLDRLWFLDLMARAKRPASEETRADVARKITAGKKELAEAVRKGDWRAAGAVCYRLERERSRLEPTEDDVLTAKGEQLLRQGEVNAKVRKVGCAK